jgi:hypothetical protein
MIKPGDVFYCFETVTLIDNGEVCYIRGKRYVSEAMGCITNEGGDKNHEWREGKMLDEFFINIKEHRKNVINTLLENGI